MRKLISNIKQFFSKHHVIFLILLVLVSYGQILFMEPWQEDNVIFFKVAHIFEQAGYLGKGILGAGPYRHTITPYYFVYKIFGYNFPIYYLLMLLSYFFATTAIYFLAKNILGKKPAMIASFLFGVGYIASEGFIRVYTSTNISSGIGFTAILFLSYWNYYKTKKLKWYFLTVFLYWITIQVTYVRAHYLILPLLVFDFLFLVLPKLSNLKKFVIRSIPLIYIFYEYYIVQGDSRREGIIELVKGLLRGDFKYLTSFLGTLGNLVIPDFLQKSPILVGLGVIVLALFLVKKLKGEKRKIFILFAVIIVANLASYSIYTPFVVYATKYRYLAHSFFALCVILALFTTFKKRFITYFLVTWGIMFLILGVSEQKMILSNRTQKIHNFYTTLKKDLPVLPVGSLIYFDTQDNPEARQMYSVSFSVAEMPETTALAWRYGIDRYDIKMFTNYDNLASEITQNKTPLDKVYTFWISKDGLVNTTEEFRKLGSLRIKPSVQTQNLPIISQTKIDGEKILHEDIVIDLSNPISSVIPLNLNFQISAQPMNIANLDFPLNSSNTTNQTYNNPTLMNSAFKYNGEKEFDIKHVVYKTDSQWQERILPNIHDANVDTIWQADRVLWNTQKAFIEMDLGNIRNIGGIAWINGSPNNTPTKYKVESSLDEKNWEQNASTFNPQKVNDKTVQTIKFDPVNARFFKLTIDETFVGDSPQIAEIWPVSSEFINYNLEDLEEFANRPFDLIINNNAFINNLRNTKYKQKAQIYWMGNQSQKWLTTNTDFIDITYDGMNRNYSIEIPQSGTQINKIKIADFRLPGIVSVNYLSVQNQPIQ